MRPSFKYKITFFVFSYVFTDAPHIVKLKIPASDPRWISLLLLGSARAIFLYIDLLLLPADKPN